VLSLVGKHPAAALSVTFLGLDVAAFDGYVTGLRESGIRIEYRLLRLGMAPTSRLCIGGETG
jgi:hypothetical protein